MKHRSDCSKSGELVGDCDECRQCFEHETHVCAHCWQPVTNGAFFGKRGKSPHLTGQCSKRTDGPAKSWFERRSLSNPKLAAGQLASYWHSSEEAVRLHKPQYPMPEGWTLLDESAPRVRVLTHRDDDLLFSIETAA